MGNADECVNANEAAAICGVSYATMRAWLKAGKIEGAERVQRPGEPWNWSIPRSALEAHRAQRRVAGGDLGAVERLQRENEELRAALARAQRRHVASSAPDGESPIPPPASSDLAVSASGGHTRKKGSVPMSARDPLPADWIPFNTGFCYEHGDLDARSMSRENTWPEYPRPHDRGPDRANWWRGHGDHPQPVRMAYDPEQHRNAARLAARDWPQKFTSCDLCRDALEG